MAYMMTRVMLNLLMLFLLVVPQSAYAQDKGKRAEAAKPPPSLALPADVVLEIQPPAPNSPPEHVDLIGKWGGYWGNVNPSNLIVESITRSGVVRGVYVFSSSRTKQIEVAKIRAKFAEGILSWGDPTKGVGFEFKVGKEGKLIGERFDRGMQSGSIVMTKIP
jgi:hypothetical protein